MASLSRSDSISQSTGTPTLSSKALPSAGLASQKSGKPAASAQRIDLEPLYTTLKQAIGDKDWAIYKESISQFILGQLNQNELSSRIDRFITTDPAREHAHNQFLCAIYANATREPPEPGVATWVSASDKPSAATKAVSGDGAEQRLKEEVMALPARERRRLKQIQDEPFDMFAREMNDYHRARQIVLPDVGPTSAGGYNKTNLEPEIRKRYNQPLFQETNEFPDTSTIEQRMIPICYEEGLPNGATAGCAEFMEIATEMFIKEALSDLYGRVSSNGDSYIKTESFRRQLEKEQRMLSKGEIHKNAAGQLPVEAEVIAKRNPLSMSDVRLALELGDSFVGQVPLIAGRILNLGYEDTDLETWRREEAVERARPGLNGFPSSRGYGGRGEGGNAPSQHDHNHYADAMDVDGPEYMGWPGGGNADLDVLNSALDGFLAVGS